MEILRYHWKLGNGTTFTMTKVKHPTPLNTAQHVTWPEGGEATWWVRDRDLPSTLTCDATRTDSDVTIKVGCDIDDDDDALMHARTDAAFLSLTWVACVGRGWCPTPDGTGVRMYAVVVYICVWVRPPVCVRCE